MSDKYVYPSEYVRRYIGTAFIRCIRTDLFVLY